jgi:aminoglycoside phosphotransferase (APT) family kinase protein
VQLSAADPLTDVRAIDHDWLRRHLGWSLTGGEAITVRSVSPSGGLMGSVHQVRCAGRSFIFKGPPENLTGWGGVVLAAGLLEREVHAYRFLRERGRAVKIGPECYWSVVTSGGRAALALEDLGPPAHPGARMASGLSRPQAFAAVRCLAILHATTASAAADPLSPPYPWLYSASSDELVAAVEMGLDDLPRLIAERWPAHPPAIDVQRIARLDVRRVLAEAHVGAAFPSVCHGDAWAGNVLFTAPPGRDRELTAYLIDWQFAMWGNPLTDVALVLLSSLEPAARRAWQDDLLAHYHATLTAHCYLRCTLDDCRAALREAEPFAALVALATLESYTSGMGAAELAQFAGRVLAVAERVGVLFHAGPTRR